MTVEILILGIGFVVLIGVQIFLALRKNASSASNTHTELLLNQLAELRRDVDQKLGENTKTVHSTLTTQLKESSKIASEAQRVQRDVIERLTKLDETNKQVVGFADQLQNLQDILQNPKQRGELGEYYLESVLKDIFPPGRYKMQYAFKNGEAVDAALFLQDKKILPIDSKFSLENYRRVLETRDASEREKYEKAFVNDLKTRIKETAKYIRPEENTMDFAFMFIPSEAIYYDLLSNKVGVIEGENLIQRAYTKYKVVVVSPTTFVAYLQTVMQGLKSLQIEEQARDIQKRVGELGKHLGAYNEYMLKLGKSLGTTVNHYNAAHKELGKVDKDVVRITGESPELETLSLERPQ